ncbi:hypothetical protein [Desertivirga brevis]|uniref:hypothetical protein n=1 Tax=Desertivirga brevis TaxID=2810310 RepID=UPI001A9699CE|nr:hypothetical protein [Pedobacter sp. SYSU D00873]
MEFPSETSHAKNVSNFGSLLVSIEVLGNLYNPGKEGLKLVHLKTLHRQGKSVMQGVALSLGVYAAAVESRRKAWEGIDSLAKRILDVYEKSEEESSKTSSLSTLLNQVKGDSGSFAEHVTVQQGLKFNALLSRLSFEERLDSFEELISMISESSVGASERGLLLITSLHALQSNFRSKNINVKLAEAALNTARYNRDVLLYKQENNLVSVAEEVKDYIKNTLGPSFSQYMQIMDMTFIPS